jgi:hypothetical protein
MKVIPAQVAEEVVRKTLKGDTITYKLIFGKDKQVFADLDKVEGEIFTSPDEVKRVLTDKILKTVNQIVNTAVKSAGQWYEVHEDPTAQINNHVNLADSIHESDILESADDPYAAARESSSDNLVTLPDGTVAKVRAFNIPEELKNK